MTPALTLVPDAPETDAQASRRLSAEAAERAAHAVENLLHNLSCAEADLTAMAGLQALPPGIREECRQLAAQVVLRADTIMAILGRGR